MMELIHEVEHETCPYHLRFLVHRAAHSQYPQLSIQCVHWDFVVGFDAEDPSDHGSVILTKTQQVWGRGCPGLLWHHCALLYSVRF